MSTKNTAIAIKLAVDAGAVKPGLSQVQAEFASSSAKINQALASIKGFSELKRQTDATAQAYAQARARVEELARSVRNGAGGAALAKDFELAKTEAARLKDELGRQQQELQRVRGTMAETGVSTSGLAGQQAKLRTELDATRQKYQQMAEMARAKDTLGITRQQAVTAEVAKTRQAYETLRASGQLSMTELGKAKQAMRGRIRELTKETDGWRTALGRVSAAVGGMAVGRMLQVATRDASQFRTALAEVSTLLDDTSQMDGLEKSVRRLAQEYGGDVIVNTKAMYQVISAGATDSAQAVEILTAANRLAVGGVTDVAIAADGLTSILNAYGEEAGGSANVSDALFVAMKGGKTTIGELAGSIGQVAPLAAQSGVAIDQLLASVATLTKGGISTSEAMTQVRSVLTAVLKPSKAAQDMAANLGIEFDTASIKSRGFAGWLEHVREKAGGSEDAMAQLFGSVEGLSGVLTLTGKGAESFSGILADMANKAGATDTAVDKMMDTPERRALRWQQTMKDLRISLGDAVTAFAPLLDVLGDLVRRFNELDPTTRTIAVSLGAAALAAAPLLFAFSQIGAGAQVFLQVARLAVMAQGAIVTMAARSAVALAALSPVLAMVAGALAALAVGWQIGTLLNQFDIVQKAGVTMAHLLTMGWLKAREAWTKLTLGDTEGIRREMDIARQTYASMMDEIDGKAQQSATTRVAAEEQVAAAVVESAGVQQQVTGEALKEMEAAYKEYADEIKRLQGEIIGRERSLVAELRELSRSGMDGTSAWEDQKKEAEEYEVAARNAAAQAAEAFAAGDTETAGLKWNEAISFADDAKAAYGRLNKEVKDGEDVTVSSQKALEATMQGVERSGNLAIEILRQQQEAAHGAMEALTSESGFQNLSAGMDEAERQWQENWRSMRAAAEKDLDAVEERIVKMVDKERTVWVNVRATDLEGKALGGEVGGYRRGGMIQALAQGGPVRSVLSGGHLPGFGGGDRRLLLGEDGEVMINKASVRAAGLKAALAFNAGRWDVVMAELAKRTRQRIGYQLGGLVSSLPSISVPPVQRLAAGGLVGGGRGSSSEDAPVRVVELRFAGGSLQGDEQSVDALLRHLEQAGLRA